jgi:hypothetical protein
MPTTVLAKTALGRLVADPPLLVNSAPLSIGAAPAMFLVVLVNDQGAPIKVPAK